MHIILAGSTYVVTPSLHRGVTLIASRLPVLAPVSNSGATPQLFVPGFYFYSSMRRLPDMQAEFWAANNDRKPNNHNNDKTEDEPNTYLEMSTNVLTVVLLMQVLVL